MLSIFDEANTTPKINGKLTMERLNHLLGPQEDMNPGVQSNPLGSDIGSKLVAPATEPELRKGNADLPVSHPLSEPNPGPVLQTGTADSAKIHQIADQFTRNISEAVGRAVTDVQRLMDKEREKSQMALDLCSIASRETEALKAHLVKQAERLDSLASAQQETSLRLGKAEERLGAEVNGSLQELKQSLSKRLDAQADAIRMLYGSLNDRDQRVERLFAVFQAMKDTSSPGTVPRRPPENL